MKMGRLMKYKKFHNNLSETDKPVGCQKVCKIKMYLKNGGYLLLTVDAINIYLWLFLFQLQLRFSFIRGWLVCYYT